MKDEEKKINSEVEKKKVANEEVLSEDELNAVAGGEEEDFGCMYAAMVEYERNGGLCARGNLPQLD